MKFLTKLFAVATLALSAVAFAGGPGTDANTTVVKIKSDSAGHVYIYFAANVAAGPSCATQYKGMVLDVTTSGGREEAQIATMAYMSGKTVTVVGQGTCALVSGWETLDAIEMTDSDRTTTSLAVGKAQP